MHHIEKVLNDNLQRYNRQEFIHTDPVQIPHRFTRKEDIEISALLTATIAWPAVVYLAHQRAAPDD